MFIYQRVMVIGTIVNITVVCWIVPEVGNASWYML